MTETLPPWFQRVTDILGLYELTGDADNPTILAMAKACGGNIAKVYKHDATAWCALTQNYTLISTGFRGNDSLWALDFRKYGVKLPGPAVGAIATKTRDGGGHVFQVVGRTADGKIVGRGGNQGDMVCDETFDPSVLAYNWPSEYPLPKTGMAVLPVVKPLPHTKRSVTLPGSVISKPSIPAPAKPAATAKPQTPTRVAPKAAGAAGVAAATGWGAWHFFQAYPVPTVCGVVAAIALAIYLIKRK